MISLKLFGSLCFLFVYPCYYLVYLRFENYIEQSLVENLFRFYIYAFAAIVLVSRSVISVVYPHCRRFTSSFPSTSSEENCTRR